MDEAKWNEVRRECRRATVYFNRQGIEPTLRALFYHLLSAKVIPPSSKHYHLLSSHLEDWGEGCSEDPKNPDREKRLESAEKTLCEGQR